MKPRQHRTKAIILNRTDFGEADRILTFLTTDSGKVRAIAKAARKSTSKLAGGIELFSISDISFVSGRGDLKTITSTRLIKHYGNIVKDMERTNAAYEFIKLLDKATEDNTDGEYFNILSGAFTALDDAQIDLNLISIWFDSQLLRLSGHSPNLRSDSAGNKLAAEKTYDFNLDEMCFVAPASRAGSFKADHIKFLRLLFSGHDPKAIQKIKEAPALALALLQTVQAMRQAHIHS